MWAADAIEAKLARLQRAKTTQATAALHSRDLADRCRPYGSTATVHLWRSLLPGRGGSGRPGT